MELFSIKRGRASLVVHDRGDYLDIEIVDGLLGKGWSLDPEQSRRLAALMTEWSDAQAEGGMFISYVDLSAA